MNESLIDQVVNAVLYEGYILYPYRPSSTKNRHRFTFGRVYPVAYSAYTNGAEPCMMQTECVVRSLGPEPAVEVSVRFLHPMDREVGTAEAIFEPLPELWVDRKLHQSWQEAVERTVALPYTRLYPTKNGTGGAGSSVLPFSFPESTSLEAIRDCEGRVAGMFRREQCAIEGYVELISQPIDLGIFRITVRVHNRTPMRTAECGKESSVLLRTFASTHTILHAQDAEFISLTDPPPDLAPAVADCTNLGGWPVLVGDEAKAERHTMLASPIILYDYPRIAPQSAGDLFDGTEIDEILTLRIMTLTDGEKLEVSDADDLARRILERTSTLPEHTLLRMHGTMGDPHAETPFPFDSNAPLESVLVRGTLVRAGDRVRIHPKGRADIMDIALEGQVAIVEAIEQDAEDRIYLALVLEDDPGRDLGMMRQPGHRFFYTTEEIEPLEVKP